MSITPLKFTGVSTFSADFQQIMDRAVSIAALPVKELQNDQATLLNKKQALSSIGDGVSALADAVRNLGTVGNTSALTVTSTNTNRVTVTNNGLTSPASYSLTEITSIAKAASETTATGLATANSTAVDGDGHLQLVFGDQTYDIDVSDSNNLNAVAQKINDLELGLNATVLNTGSVGNPFYLSLTSGSTGATTLELRSTAGDSGSNLLTADNQGANAEFKLNGLPVSKSDNVISDVIPNLTFTILSETTGSETVTLAAQSSRGALGNAIQSFVDAYNALASARNGQIGEQAGVLSGDFIINQIGRALAGLKGYSSPGSAVGSLASVGVTLDKTGKMTFDTTQFYSLSSSTVTAAYGFFKSTGGGFGSLAASLDTISNPLTGMIKTQQAQYDATDKRLSSQIDVLTTRITQMQTSLQTKLDQADSLLAMLQSQQTLLKASFDSVNLALYGKKDS